MEILLAASLLSMALVPLFFIFRLSRPADRKTETEFMATLLAHHVLEKIVAAKMESPEVLPAMTTEKPVVVTHDGFQHVSEYFRDFLGHEFGLEEQDIPDLFHFLKAYRCQVDTYYLEGDIYKVIVYILYQEQDRQKRVFLERLLDHPPPQSISELTP